MMIVPEAVNMPSTPGQTEILAPWTWAGARPGIWRTLRPTCRNACRSNAATIGVSRRIVAGGDIVPRNEGAGLTAGHKVQILESIDRQVRRTGRPAPV
jgi:hypothetical protein